MAIDFQAAFEGLTGRSPFRWQRRLFERLARGEMPNACDIPTGLGKTSVMAIWLAALDLRDPELRLPRRLIYVVDRRAVVDQATDEAESLARNLGNGIKVPGHEDDVRARAINALRDRLRLGPGRELPVSTLRGQFADNRAWLDDPSAPAIVVGTVDMIGSRLLFSGYGVSSRMRPVQAALLGADALIVLDEAHLVPPFQALVEQVAERAATDSGREARPLFRIPPMQTMALSATGRKTKGPVFTLENADIDEDEVVAQRVNAPKRLKLEYAPGGDLSETMAARAHEIAAGRHRVIVFCNSRKIAQGVYDKLKGSLGKNAQVGGNLELIVGARRVREREQLADSPVFRRFARLPPKEGNAAPAGAAFLVATSAGEVGVDIDADHVVCDLVAWERMVQRLGRVNRRGDCPESLIDVLVAAPDKETEAPTGTPTAEEFRKPFDSDVWTRRDDGRLDASPGALRRLRESAEFRTLADGATTGEPLRPPLTRALVDAWSMTSLEEHTGRTEVAPWIRGWIDKEAPQTEVVWRRLLPLRAGDALNETKRTEAKRELTRFFAAAPPHISEILEAETFRVVEMLRARAKLLLKRQGKEVATDDAPADDHAEAEVAVEAAMRVMPRLIGRTIVAAVLHSDSSVERLLRLDDLQNQNANRLQSWLANRRVVLDAGIGGLAPSGLLDSKEAAMPATLDGERVERVEQENVEGKQLWSEERLRHEGYGFRVRTEQHDKTEESWKIVYRRFTDAESEEVDDADQHIEWRVEEWVGARAAGSEPALARSRQTLPDHHSAIERSAARIAQALNLPDDLRTMLIVAARHHDFGKARVIWQRYAGNPGFARDPQRHPPLAKFDSWGDPRLLRVGDGSYRHEFGSLYDAVESKAFDGLAPPLRMLGLHLIAAHHGRARPAIFAYDECCTVERSIGLAEQVMRSFAALQAEWGPWGLAWWEALLRAADVAASREQPEQGAS